MTPADPTPVPPHLSDAERALWEKADHARREIANEVPASEPQWYTAYEAWRDHGYTKPVAEFIDAASPEFIHSLLTALSSERAAGEREKTDAARYHRLRSIALGDDCDAWTAWYFLVDDVMPEGPAMFDKAVDAHTPEPAHD